MSLAHLDEDYRQKVRALCRALVTLELNGDGTPPEHRREGGYIRYFMGPTYGARDRRKPDTPFSVGMDPQDLEAEIDNRMSELAQEDGQIWAEGLFTGDDGPTKSLHTHSSPPRRGLDLASIVRERGGTDALLASYAEGMQVAVSGFHRSMDQSIRMVEGFDRLLVEFGSLKTLYEVAKRQGNSEAWAAAWSAIGGAISAIGPDVVKEILGPAIRAKFGDRVGSDGEVLEQPSEPGLERLRWNLDLIERCGQDLAIDLQALGGKIPKEETARIQRLVNMVKAVVTPMQAAAKEAAAKEEDPDHA